MSTDSMWDVQAGVYARLSTALSLTGLLAPGAAGVLDHVPDGTRFPYVVMGEADLAPLDTQGCLGAEVVVTIHTYTRTPGMQKAKQIMAEIYALLHNADFSIPNQTLVLCRNVLSTTRLAEDGITRHGVQRFRIVTEPL